MAQKSVKDIQVTPFADLFKDDEQRQIESGERIVQLEINDIHEFEGHPFQVRMDEDMYKLVDSVKDNGVLVPSLSQAQRMKSLSCDKHLSEDTIFAIMTEEKANQKDKLTFKMDEIDRYFPKEYTPRQKQELVITLLKRHAQKLKNKDVER